ncbi:MAG: 30S ribosomal protein S13 [Candidatus Neomarinimicrobiota bacterium]|nr:MAG: 30S ribosomal protein S13 [Candidatus Neomarinimicrobiota bacterium]
MARIVGVDIPRNKKVPYSLCYIHGIGLTTARQLCETAKIDFDSRVQDLTEKQIVGLRNAISNLNLKVEGELRSDVAINIKRLKDAGAYRGLDIEGLPANGQRTKPMLEQGKVKNELLVLEKAHKK